MKIFSDAKLEPAAAENLRDGVTPHELLISKYLGASVLAKAAPDPAFGEAEIAFGQPDPGSVENSDNLRWVHLSSAGFTRYDTPEFRALATSRGIVVTNSSSVYAESCAEHAFAFMLAQSRRLPKALASQTASGTPEWFQLRTTSSELRGQSVLILGYGSIAQRLAEMLAPFQMQITAMRRAPRGDESVKIVTPENLAPALAAADHIVSVLPENEASRHFIDREKLAAMKSGAIFYNIGRGATVDQQALAEALHSSHLAAAWLDVTDPEPLPADHALRLAPHCFITPHTAGGHRDESGTLVRHFLANFQLYVAGTALRDRIM